MPVVINNFRACIQHVTSLTTGKYIQEGNQGIKHLDRYEYNGNRAKEALLRCVPEAGAYYPDNLGAYLYTLQGLSGDQSLERPTNHKMFDAGRVFFLVSKEGRNHYIYHGKFRLDFTYGDNGAMAIRCKGKDGIMRTAYQVRLVPI